MTSKDGNQQKSKSKSVFAGLLVALAILFGWCGRGFFLGDGKPGKDSDEKESTAKENAEQVQPTDDATPARCALRVDAEGIKLGGQPSEVEGAVAACTASGEADLTVTGDAKFGTVDALRTALDAAGVRVFEAKRGAQTPDGIQTPSEPTEPSGSGSR